jgi:hypothetical protein
VKNFTKSLSWCCRDPYTRSRHDGVLPYLTLCPPPDADLKGRAAPCGAPPAAGRTWTHTTTIGRSSVRMLLSFQRPSSPLLKRTSLREETRPARRPKTPSGRPKSIALLLCVVRRAQSTASAQNRAASHYRAFPDRTPPGSRAKAAPRPAQRARSRRKRRLPTRSTRPSRSAAGRSCSPALNARSPTLTPP